MHPGDVDSQDRVHFISPPLWIQAVPSENAGSMIQHPFIAVEVIGFSPVD